MDPSMMKQLAIGTIPPGLVGVMVLIFWWWRERSDPSTRHWARSLGAAALGLAFVPISALVLGKLSFPPTSGSQWVPWFGVVGAIAALVAARWSGNAALVWGVRIVAVLVVGWVSVRGQGQAGWSDAQVAEALAGFAVLTLVVLAMFDRVLGARPTERSMIVPTFVAMTMLGGIAQVLVLGFFSLALAQAAGVAAALTGGVLVGSLWKRDVIARRGMLDAPLVLGSAMLLHGYLFGDAERPWLFVGLLAASPLAAVVARAALPSKWRAWKRGVIEVAAGFAPVAVAVGIALAQRPQE